MQKSKITFFSKISSIESAKEYCKWAGIYGYILSGFMSLGVFAALFVPGKSLSEEELYSWLVALVLSSLVFLKQSRIAASMLFLACLAGAISQIGDDRVDITTIAISLSGLFLFGRGVLGSFAFQKFKKQLAVE